MPALTVDQAMERSLKDGVLDLLARSVHAALYRRDLTGQIGDVRNAFSSWDNCMATTYCKWPAIGLMIVAGILVISVAWCLIRCACCAKSCCCECFSCLKCCGNCCGCCDPPRGNKKEYLQEPYMPPNQGYKAPEPMHHGFGVPASHHGGQSHGVYDNGGGFGGSTSTSTKKADFPQYAEFDSGGKSTGKHSGNEDSLPAMPSWEGAESKQIAVEEEAVELSQLKKPEAQTQPQSPTMINGASAMNAGPQRMNTGPQRTTPSPGPRSPYGPPGPNPAGNGHYPPSAMDNDPYSQTAQSYNQPGGYGQQDQGYGVQGGAMAPGRRSPYDDNNGHSNGYNNNNKTPYGQARAGPQQPGYGGYDGYGQQPYDNYDSQADQGYGMPQHPPAQEFDGAGYGQGSMKSPSAQNGGYGGYGQDPRRGQGSQDDYSNGYGRPLRSPTAAQGDYSSPYGADSRRTPAPQGADYSSPYGADSRRSPAAQGGDYYSQQRTQSPAPQADYGNGYNSRPGITPQYSSESTQPLRAPQRQYTGSDMNASTGVTPADGGFDFSSGYSRPAPAANGGYRQPSPVSDNFQQQSTTSGYPGFKPYSPGP
ncbi:hypothetical protein QBC44DRAFT_122591 [Cladorrhinum sp. PSN332]|nr:hypothetical protein QBC44DRAFT_122591 [Cladorrhinum sp. PSN332]